MKKILTLIALVLTLKVSATRFNAYAKTQTSVLETVTQISDLGILELELVEGSVSVNFVKGKIDLNYEALTKCYPGQFCPAVISLPKTYSVPITKFLPKRCGGFQYIGESNDTPVDGQKIVIIVNDNVGSLCATDQTPTTVSLKVGIVNRLANKYFETRYEFTGDEFVSEF